jgi:hypothetical protein
MQHTNQSIQFHLSLGNKFCQLIFPAQTTYKVCQQTVNVTWIIQQYTLLSHYSSLTWCNVCQFMSLI